MRSRVRAERVLLVAQNLVKLVVFVDPMPVGRRSEKTPWDVSGTRTIIDLSIAQPPGAFWAAPTVRSPGWSPRSI